jgi:hypothetical protein
MSEKAIEVLRAVDDGRLLAAVERELVAVTKNVQDPNTGFKPREITIKVKFTPSGGRDVLTPDYVVTSKLQPIVPRAVVALYVTDDGEIVTRNTRQYDLLDSSPAATPAPAVSSATPSTPPAIMAAA